MNNLDTEREDHTQAQIKSPLSDAEILDLLPVRQVGWCAETYNLWFARAIERAHGIKKGN